MAPLTEFSRKSQELAKNIVREFENVVLSVYRKDTVYSYKMLVHDLGRAMKTSLMSRPNSIKLIQGSKEGVNNSRVNSFLSETGILNLIVDILY